MVSLELVLGKWLDAAMLGTTSIHGATPANGAIAPAPAFAKGTTHTVHDFDLYKIEIVKKRLSKDQARILRGDGTLFATFKGQRVLFEASGADINRRDIIYHKSTFGARRHFEVAGQEYVFEDSSKYRDKCLVRSVLAFHHSKRARPALPDSQEQQGLGAAGRL
jgi:hypothetical protein